MKPSGSRVESGQVKLVPAVARAGAILDHIAERGAAVGLADLARDLDLPKSSVHGLCHTLCAMRLLRAVPGGGFALGPHLLHWSGAMLASTDLVGEFHALLAEDRRLDGYTVTLSALDRGDVVYLACRNSDAPLGVTFRIGMRLPAVFTATGKAMLAALDPAGLRAALPRRWPQPMTARSVADRAALERELAEVRKRGFAIDDGQVRDGMRCLGAAIIDSAGQPSAGIALSLAAGEADVDAGAAVVAIAAALSAHA